MELAAYITLAVLVVVTAGLVALRPRPFPPSLSVDELNGFARQNIADPGRGTEALSAFYGWRQDLWSGLARGTGAIAVALLLALVGASLEAGKTVKEEVPEPPAEVSSTVVTPSDVTTSPATLALIGGLAVFGTGVWFRARAVQREFARDVARLG